MHQPKNCGLTDYGDVSLPSKKCNMMLNFLWNVLYTSTTYSCDLSNNYTCIFNKVTASDRCIQTTCPKAENIRLELFSVLRLLNTDICITEHFDLQLTRKWSVEMNIDPITTAVLLKNSCLARLCKSPRTVLGCHLHQTIVWNNSTLLTN